MIESIGETVRKAENNYSAGSTTISEFVEFSQNDNINRIEAYLHSKHTSGAEDSLGREKPFFNVVTAAANIWYRATNIARSKIRIRATKFSHTVLAFIGTIHIQEWMKRTNFDQFLDDWGRTLARYGSALTKWVEKDGELIASVVPWNRLICDTIEFDGNVAIEKLTFTPAQLKKKTEYDQEVVEKLIEARSAREDNRKMKRDNKNDYITLYEVHGELPLALLTDKESDEDEYVQQMHVVSFVEKGDRTSEYDDFSLYSGKEKNPYVITHLIKEEGRTQGIGAVEHLFDAQWMTNHSIKLIKDQLDLASQLIFQTSDGAFVGKNILSELISGDILIHKENQPLTALNNTSHDIVALQNFATQWQALAQEVTSTPDAVRGNDQPSGTPFRSVLIQNQQALSLFEVMTRNKKRYLEKMVREYVIPHVKKKMDTSEEIAATLESQDITKLDALYVPAEAIRRDNEQIKRKVLSGEIAENLDPQATQATIQGELGSLGNQRFLKPSDIDTASWKEVLKDLEWETDIDIEDKTTDEQNALQSLIEWFKLMVNPAVQAYLATPQGKLVSNRILEKTHAISPLELSQLPTTPPTQPQIAPPMAPPQVSPTQSTPQPLTR